MKFIVDGKSIEVPDQLLIEAGNHAESRGMTLEEYIAEAFTMLKKDEQSCGGTPEGWISEETFQKQNNYDVSHTYPQEYNNYDANGSPVPDLDYVAHRKRFKIKKTPIIQDWLDRTNSTYSTPPDWEDYD